VVCHEGYLDGTTPWKKCQSPFSGHPAEGCELRIVIILVEERDSLSPAGDCPNANRFHCGGEGWGEGGAFALDPLIRPSGQFCSARFLRMASDMVFHANLLLHGGSRW
jgi:hypothetical protein